RTGKRTPAGLGGPVASGGSRATVRSPARVGATGRNLVARNCVQQGLTARRSRLTPIPFSGGDWLPQLALASQEGHGLEPERKRRVNLTVAAVSSLAVAMLLTSFGCSG